MSHPVNRRQRRSLLPLLGALRGQVTTASSSMMDRVKASFLARRAQEKAAEERQLQAEWEALPAAEKAEIDRMIALHDARSAPLRGAALQAARLRSVRPREGASAFPQPVVAAVDLPPTRAQLVEKFQAMADPAERADFFKQHSAVINKSWDHTTADELKQEHTRLLESNPLVAGEFYWNHRAVLRQNFVSPQQQARVESESLTAQYKALLDMGDISAAASFYEKYQDQMTTTVTPNLGSGATMSREELLGEYNCLLREGKPSEAAQFYLDHEVALLGPSSANEAHFGRARSD